MNIQALLSKIVPGSTKAQNTDPAVVVALRPSDNAVLIPDIGATGALTAAQATPGTPVAGGTVALTITGGQSEWKLQLSGTFSAGSTVLIEGSVDGGTTWWPVSGHSSGGISGVAVNTVVGGASLLIAGLVAGLTNIRARCSVFTVADSITVTWRSGAGTGHVSLLAALPVGTNQIGVVGGLSVVASASFTRSANTTAYSANQVVTAAAGGSVAIAGCVQAAGRSGLLLSVTLVDAVNAATPLQPIVLIFNAAPTSLADNAAVALVSGDIAKLVHIIPLFESYLTNSSASPNGQRIWVARGLSIPYTVAVGTSLSYYVLSGAAYTPVSGEVFTLILGTEQN